MVGSWLIVCQWFDSLGGTRAGSKGIGEINHLPAPCESGCAQQNFDTGIDCLTGRPIDHLRWLGFQEHDVSHGNLGTFKFNADFNEIFQQ